MFSFISPWCSNLHLFPIEPFFAYDTIVSKDVSTPVEASGTEREKVEALSVIVMNPFFFFGRVHIY
jgi:hypothetical protein